MSKKLLVVEDSKAIVSIIKKIGESLGYEVSIAESLAEVETLMQSNTEYFAATIDYALPDAENGEAIATILSHGIPGVVMTGKMDDETRKKILDQPVIDYIPKENSQAFMYLKRILYWQSANIGTGVLVVDDSVTARNHISELLKRRNFTVYAAESGVEALKILQKQNDIKMVITDLEMPGMDGIELTNEIRKVYNRDQMTVIGISGADNATYSARIIKNGADDFIRKPFCPEEFYCRITQHVENLHNIVKIQKAANTDYLTELPNRRAFFKKARKSIAYYAENKIPYGLAMIDIDFFKTVNDTYGHEAGDHILKMLAENMEKCLTEASLARFGGEEFAILLPGSDQAAIYQQLDVFREKIASAQFNHDEHYINFTVSIGVVFNSVSSLEDQLNQADIALYSAKENGRNQIVIST
ncbi:diguanylate cyclase [Colwellia sp. 1_MG-2023]|uniref:response regulator n=1 Tax=Colwellia sp. 1_MG-2023 TaxID=3062649 RepID=UPI0026E13CEC|nr:response regulator [Colwellia sp. 1_MG-2023]MDO6445262.1 diguanylate cyclase [Colwellia sp. 1_MG-2023]